MSEPFNIQMSRARVITVAACFIVAGLLLFAAGAVAGLLVASASIKSLAVEAQLPATKPAIEPIKKPEAPALSAPATATAASGETPSANSPASATTSQTAPPAGPSSQSAATAAAAPPTPTPAAAAPASSTTAAPSAAASATAEPSAESSYAIPLAIKVCSFTGKASAEAMITALAAKGYRASLGHSSGANGRTWYVVKLGPYKEWNTASNVAARVAIAENVKPVIGPMQ